MLTTQYPPLLFGNEMSNADTTPIAEANKAEAVTTFIVATREQQDEIEGQMDHGEKAVAESKRKEKGEEFCATTAFSSRIAGICSCSGFGPGYAHI